MILDNHSPFIFLPGLIKLLDSLDRESETQYEINVGIRDLDNDTVPDPPQTEKQCCAGGYQYSGKNESLLVLVLSLRRHILGN